MPITKPTIAFVDQKKQYKKIAEQLAVSMKKVYDHGQFILGPEVAELEQALKLRVEADDAITLANGTDALTMALMVRKVAANDVVFVPEFTFCATAGAVARLGAVPYFVDIDPNSYNICPNSLEKAIEASLKQGYKPVGVIAVDIFGLPAEYDALNAVIKKHGLWLIEDAAQSFGATYRGQVVGAFESLVATSFYPTKPLSCFGDGGALFVNGEAESAALVRSLKVHGQGLQRYDSAYVGFNSRLDTMQAAVLLEKLKVFNQELSARSALASMYDALLDEKYVRQTIAKHLTSAYAQYCLLLPVGMDRCSWQNAMNNQGVPTMVYYPKLLSTQVAYQAYPTVVKEDSFSHEICKRIVALPMHGYMDEESTMRIVHASQTALKMCS